MQHGMVGVDTQFSIQRLLVLNPHGGDATVVGAADAGRQAVADMDGLMGFAVGEFEGFVEDRGRRLFLRLLATDNDVIDMLGQVHPLDLGDL